ncbi:helix-turn-helix transcriptional regulator [Streptomyces sp. TRM66268-LWL]|uniref:Helix-turn-helix transcriptional regulator n=1 Tax=Streptomyces polyasparticus TaxID=2767826 RepID=A0ABR7S9Y4_9ACTN|nr:helix-turn-helix transcriptional regulator [Streptomyces polyasparticus]MBC9712233.1 helix-turn-helix transcriptional regulator [Streptomyces polyasparticus]
MHDFDHAELKSLRSRRGSIPRVAAATDIPASRFYDWEAGNGCPSSKHLISLALFFGIHPYDLFTGITESQLERPKPLASISPYLALCKAASEADDDA